MATVNMHVSNIAELYLCCDPNYQGSEVTVTAKNISREDPVSCLHLCSDLAGQVQGLLHADKNNQVQHKTGQAPEHLLQN